MKDSKHVILIIEDEAALLDSYAEIVEGGGFTALKGSDGYKGLDVLKENKDSVDLILLDLMMPGMDGLDVLEQIRNDEGSYGNAPVIVLTNLSSERVIKEAFERGASGYLMKTEIEPENVVSEIQTVLDSATAK
jgi:CheY-like chemotaxis protein